jgi:flavin-dependent dehydrogenase
MGFAEETEIVVIGGGPGGSTTATRLAQKGRKVLLLERDKLPRFHIGESLLPSSTPVLRELGVFEELDRVFLRKYGARFLDDGNMAEAQYLFSEAFPPAIPHAWQVTRYDFDEILIRNAQKHGVVVRENTKVKDFVREGSRAIGVELEDGTRIGAKVVVDATGRDALFARGRKDKKRIAGLDKTAIFTTVAGGHRNEGRDAGQIEIVILPGKNDDGSNPGWAWMIPFKTGNSSCGFVLSTKVVEKHLRDDRDLFHRDELGAVREYDDKGSKDHARLERIFDDCVSRSPWMKKLIGDSKKIEPVRAAADFSFRVEELAGDGWLAVGDSGGFLDPLFSTGAHMAMGGGLRAADAIDAALKAGDVSAASFAEYSRAVRRAGDLFLGAVQSFYRGDLRDLLFHPDQRPALRKTITSMLAGDVFHDEKLPALWVGYFHERFPARP